MHQRGSGSFLPCADARRCIVTKGGLEATKDTIGNKSNLKDTFFVVGAQSKDCKELWNQSGSLSMEQVRLQNKEQMYLLILNPSAGK
jgi:hypothetical protein